MKGQPLLVLVALLVVLLLARSLSAVTRGDAKQTQPVTLPSAQALRDRDTAACKVSTQYLPSDLEQLWVKNVAAWEADFCNHMAKVEDSTRVWLDTLTELRKAQAQYQNANTSPAEAFAQEQKMDPRVFSRFKHTYDCGNGQTSEQVTWIEPLSHGLRHPHALCRGQMDITAIMDRRYLLLAHQAEHAAATRLGNTRCRDRRCQTIYFDLGATTLQPTPEEAGQGWFYSAYRRQGFQFDRFLLWEAKTQDPAEVFKHVPKADLHKYQYFNVPVTPDTSDPSNPVNILKAIAQPGDFVVFKLDIDNYRVEHAILDAISKDPQALALIDELFFEEHVDFAPMLAVGWAGTTGPNTSLATSYAMFSALRQQGLRAHSWV